MKIFLIPKTLWELVDNDFKDKESSKQDIKKLYNKDTKVLLALQQVVSIAIFYELLVPQNLQSIKKFER